MTRDRALGWGLALLLCGAPAASHGQDPAGESPAETFSAPLPTAAQEMPGPNRAAVDDSGVGQRAGDAADPVADDSDRPLQLAQQSVRPMSEGPLHEAFLSPRKDRDPVHAPKAPSPPISERPAVDPPSANAQWIEGYWEWDAGCRDYVWVTGTWRLPPPGRFWVNGYWKRDESGWYRVPGFWSDRQTDRIDYRKNGPPKDRPSDDPGEPPSPDCFYVPGQYYPDGDGVVWKKGFWAKAQPGWAWVPAQWIRQPEGWTFQDGYWDRTLEDRGTLFAPAQVADSAQNHGNLTYQPYTRISPEMYGQLYGAFGRPNSYYDGYPGVYYDEDGRFYGYAIYGALGGYYGYLDYPHYGGYGYPYLSTPVNDGYGNGYGHPYDYGYGGNGYGYPYGYGLYGGLLSGIYGFGGGYGYPYYGGGFGLGFGYPFYGGYGGFGLGLGFGYPSWGFGLGFGYPFWGFGFGFGYPFWGYGGWGWGGYGLWHGHYPFHPGWNSGRWAGNRNWGGNRGAGGLAGGPDGRNVLAGMRGVQAPPSSRPYGNPFHNNASISRAVGRTGAGQGQIQHASSPASGNHPFRPSFNGVSSQAMQHSIARTNFASHTAGMAGRQGAMAGGNFGQGPAGMAGRGVMGGQAGALNQGMGRGNMAGAPAGGMNAGVGHGLATPGGMVGGGTAIYRGGAGAGGLGAGGMAQGGRVGAPGIGYGAGMGGSFAAPHYGGAPRAGGYMGGFHGAPMGAAPMGGGYLGGGGFRGGYGGYGGHMGGFGGGHMGGGHMGGGGRR